MKEATFLNIVNPVKDKMYRLALRLLSSKEAAQDATQEVILKLWTRKEKIKDYANVEAFAMTTTKNYCLDELKAKRNNNLRIVHQSYENNDISVHREVELLDEMNWLNKIVAGLPEQQKIIFQLRDIEQYEYEEIEKIVEMNPTAIRVSLSRARKAIRESLIKKHNYGISQN
ncbi:sigma-70 family RNA polymerase sigma factor [Gramella sp. AN32]|uniref:RNA polymerase sigma factor n=1 Tax=Christiangramia antarctica TaxID=2058158 RepID=A0ABW5X9S4_9FLAO|nr:sigma-70 family RNA polymerase sigma factor [Gramella sp. AN32]MCM4156500.1 RNA polymerase subunit sigma-70 [Gramella sp. AN32]